MNDILHEMHQVFHIYKKNIQLFLIAKITKWHLFVTYLSQMTFYIT